MSNNGCRSDPRDSRDLRDLHLMFWNMNKEKQISAFLVATLIYAGIAFGQTYSLTCKSIFIDPDPVYVGDKVVFTYTIGNIGTNAVIGGTYEIEFYIDDQMVSFDHGTLTLYSRGENTYSMSDGYWNWIANKAGPHTCHVNIVPKKTLNQSKKYDNITTKSFIVHTNPSTNRILNSISSRPRKPNYNTPADAVHQAESLVKVLFPGLTRIPAALVAFETNSVFIVRYPSLVPVEPGKTPNPYNSYPFGNEFSANGLGWRESYSTAMTLETQMKITATAILAILLLAGCARKPSLDVSGKWYSYLNGGQFTLEQNGNDIYGVGYFSSLWPSCGSFRMVRRSSPTMPLEAEAAERHCPITKCRHRSLHVSTV
jgi:hypothetical protein